MSTDPAQCGSAVATPGLSLDRLGLSDRERALFAPMVEDGFSLGRVMRMDRGIAFVGVDGAVVQAEPATHLIKTERGMDTRIAVGDWVALACPEGHDMTIVEAILPRSSSFSRKDPGEHTAGQVVAANVDVIFIMQSLYPKQPNLRRLERELVMAWDSGAQPVVLLNKVDLCPDAERYRDEVAAIALGVDVHLVSAITGDGIEELRGYSMGNKTLAFFGASGVGKSTLVNALMGEEVQATAATREGDGKGRHTTVSREMILLPDEGILIDTPGMRALALWDAEDGMAAAFPDIEALAEGCKFRDCAHESEPGCAVLAAVESDDLDESRLDSYRRLSSELVRLSEKQDVLARVERTREDKRFAKVIRRVNKERGNK